MRSEFPKYPLDSVQYTEEVHRILQLERRVRDDVSPLLGKWSRKLRKRGKKVLLRPCQEETLETFEQYGGCFGDLKVGAGKTLITFLAPHVFRSNRPLLLLPAHLIEKTEQEFWDYGKDWKAPIYSTKKLSYQMLGSKRGLGILTQHAPDLIILDEAHYMKNINASRTRAWLRYMNDNPQTKIMSLTGTAVGRSICDFHHHLLITLGAEKTPLPVTRVECENWGNALDEKSDYRVGIGSLAHFCKVREKNGTRESLRAVPKETARGAVGKFIVNTPGIVQGGGGGVGASLSIHKLLASPRSSEIDRHITRLRSEKVDPRGREIEDTDIYRLSRCLSLGFYQKFKDEPPRAYREARSAWFGYTQRIIEKIERGLDSPEQVEDALREGRLAGPGLDILAEWDEHRGLRLEPEAVFVTRNVLYHLKSTVEKGSIVWVDSIAFGNELEKMTGWSYFQNHGKDKKGRLISTVSDSIVIASVDAVRTGYNLQNWDTNILTLPPPNGEACEQLLGRTHRPGQMSEEVRVFAFVPNGEIKNQWAKVYKSAKYLRELLGQDQKLLLCGAEGDFLTMKR